MRRLMTPCPTGLLRGKSARLPLHALHLSANDMLGRGGGGGLWGVCVWEGGGGRGAFAYPLCFLPISRAPLKLSWFM